jgi:hypothetical protein
MARTKQGIFTKLSGAVGKQLVFKKYADKTVVTSYPDMSRVKPSKLQKEKRKTFAAAVLYAQAINNDPKQKALYKKKVKKGQSVYHYALKEYLVKLKGK